MANIKVSPSLFMLNLQHVLDPFTDEERKTVNGLIEINSGTINKYEFITETGHLKLDRVGYSSLAYPVAYGAIPCTWDHDGDLLDFIVANVTEPLIPGSLVEARIIGIMRFEDGGEIDDKVVTVLNDDKRMDHIKTIEDLGEHWVKEVGYYFEHYKDLKKPGTCIVKGFFDIKKAVEIIDECAKRYEDEYLPKFEEDMEECDDPDCKDPEHHHHDHSHEELKKSK